MRPAAALTAAYLAAMLPLLLLAAGEPPAPVYLAAHGAALALVAWAAVARGPAAVELLLDWAPLLLIPFLYAELPLLMTGASGGGVYHDALVQRWEAAMFGASPAVTLPQAMPWGWVSEPLHAAYFSYYALIFLPPAALYLAGRRADFALVSFCLMLAFALCFAVFTFFPVQGPRYLWDGNASPEGPVRRLVVGVLERGSSRGAAFPSSHVAVAVVQSILVLRLGLKGGWVVAMLTGGLAIGAVYGGFHYAVDSVAGALTGAIVALAAPWLYARVFRDWPGTSASETPAALEAGGGRVGKSGRFL